MMIVGVGYEENEHRRADLVEVVELQPTFQQGDWPSEEALDRLRKLGFSIRVGNDLIRELTPPWSMFSYNGKAAVVRQWLAKERAYPKAGPISG